MSVVHKELSKFVVVMAFWSVLLACIFLIWTIVITGLAIDAAILSIGIIAGMVPEALIVTAKVRLDAGPPSQARAARASADLLQGHRR